MSDLDVLFVDWLPRGGITQSTAAWRDVARAAGLRARVVGRAGDELSPDLAVERRLPTKLGAIEAHRRVVRTAVQAIRAERPAVVYVQHTWVPLLEQTVLETAAAVGARTVLAVHNAVPHQRLAGLRVGMDGLLVRADRVVAHSHHVADQLGCPAEVLALPEHAVITRAASTPVAGLDRDRARRAVAFGVLGRAYKGADALQDVAAELGPGWELVVAGVGAVPSGDGVRSCDRYLAPGELRWLVEGADVVLLPYRAASQSGAVDVAQSLGTPPVASAVGGIPEQIDDGRTGGLVPVAATPAEWAGTVERTTATVDRAVVQGDAAARHAQTARAWLDLVAPARRPTTEVAR